MKMTWIKNILKRYTTPVFVYKRVDRYAARYSLSPVKMLTSNRYIYLNKAESVKIIAFGV
jgi:hypothetical protein